MAKKGGMFDALVLGKKKPAMGDEPESDMDSDADYDDMPPGFEEEAIVAFPELDGDSVRLDAFWRAVKACVGG